MSITKQKEDVRTIDKYTDREDEDEESKKIQTLKDKERAEELQESQENLVYVEDRNAEYALTKRVQHQGQEGLRDGMRADEKSEVENEVMNEWRERENEWEEWAALEQEIDELGSGGEEDWGKKKDAQTER